MGNLVTNGNPTSTRGVVIATDSTNMNMGKNIALHGDHATCGNCGPGSWPIIASANHMRFHGRAVVQHGDWVACPCRKNQVIAVSSDMRYENSGDHQNDVVGRSSAAPAVAIVNCDMEERFSRWFLIFDSSTGAPLSNHVYIANIGGVMKQGRTDQDGYAKISSNQEKTISVHVVFKAPRHELTHTQGAPG